MNGFLKQFEAPIETFFDKGPEEPKKQVLADILQYANTNPATFKRQLKDIPFDTVNMPWAVILEALAADTDNWGDFFVETLDEIFNKAKQAAKPNAVLDSLLDFNYTEKDEKPFNQKIVDRLMRYMGDENVTIKIAAIKMLPNYLANPSIKNKQQIIDALCSQLNNPNWKVRYVAYASLGYENLLPPGKKLSLKDRVLKLILGDPMFEK
ncbi:MAG: hypothetical protein V4592_17045 [Bacteroidota bacterium]